MPGSDELLRARLNAETARIRWEELQTHFARGVVVRVAPGLDLVAVAASVARDDKEAVARWLRAGLVAPATDAQAQAWSGLGAELWAVVVAPWVLVQEGGADHE